MNYEEVYDLIQEMVDKLNHRGQVTKVFKREDYHDIFCILNNYESVMADRKVHVKVNVQHGVVTVSFRRE